MQRRRKRRDKVLQDDGGRSERFRWRRTQSRTVWEGLLRERRGNHQQLGDDLRPHLREKRRSSLWREGGDVFQ